MNARDRSPLVPPRKDDALFDSSTSDRQFGVAVNHGESAQSFAYIEGYHLAAKILAKEFLKSPAGERRLLVYSIAYLYRHCVELILKELTVQSAELLGKKLETQAVKALDKHQLDQLWRNCRPMLQGVIRVPKEDLEGITEYITQLSAIDPDGQAWRFAKRKNGDPALPDRFSGMNMIEFTGSMERLVRYLVNLYENLDMCIDSKNETWEFQDFGE